MWKSNGDKERHGEIKTTVSESCGLAVRPYLRRINDLIICICDYLLSA